MSTSDAPDEKPKRRRRRAKAEEASEVTSASGGTASSPPEADATSEGDPSAADAVAQEAAVDVVLEADAEAEGSDTAIVDEAAGVSDQPASDAAPTRAASSPTAGPKLPAPTRRRGGARPDPSLPSPVVRAHAKYVRSSARKARLVCDHIRGKSVEEARAILAHTPRAIAQDWSKLLESAVANAEHNHELVGEDLVIKAVHADEGPTIKRFRPRAMGRATQIRKRTSHLTILLTPKE